MVHTVNVVIFTGGKFRKNVGNTFHVWGNFHDTTPVSFIKAYGFYFHVGVIFAKKTKARKMQKLPSTRKFLHLQERILLSRCLLIPTGNADSFGHLVSSH